MTPKEWLVDIADAAADLGLSIRSLSETKVELYGSADATVTIESHFLSGRLLRSVLRPRPDPASLTGYEPFHDETLRVTVTNAVAKIP